MHKCISCMKCMKFRIRTGHLLARSSSTLTCRILEGGNLCSWISTAFLLFIQSLTALICASDGDISVIKSSPGFPALALGSICFILATFSDILAAPDSTHRKRYASKIKVSCGQSQLNNGATEGDQIQHKYC